MRLFPDRKFDLTVIGAGIAVEEKEVEALQDLQDIAGGVDNGYFSARESAACKSGGRGFDSRRGRKST